MSPRFLDTFRKKSLDPSRSDTVFATYDEERGYRAYHEHCHTLLKKTINNDANDTLSLQGIEHIQAIDTTVASDTLSTIISESNVLAQKETIDYSEMLAMPNTHFIENLCVKIFTPAFEQKLVQYFKSEYCIYWHTILRASPSPQARRSFLWHCDKGPSCHIKLLLYLNGTDEHGGNTKFLDRHTTKRFAETGYLFGPVDARQPDLSSLAKAANIEYHPQQWDMQPGDGILFEPSQILHCGILPTKGPRYVIAFCLLPSPLPWHEALQRTQGKSMSQGYAWHANADDIRKVLHS
ncbi:MAG: hypothetical protein NPIRA01_36540 [Nitrospirales bacterium]|nr:MAG: hypothetical protein NPIRA01_36540 [Nitrospirales bacterium]